MPLPDILSLNAPPFCICLQITSFGLLINEACLENDTREMETEISGFAA